MADSSNRITYDSNYDSDTYGGKRSHSVINDIATNGVASQAVNESIYSYLPGRENGPADAYRHLLLSAELARTNTETFARTVLAGHEFTGNAQDQTPEANKMDEHNNELGIQLGLRLKNRPDGGSWEMVIQGARELINNGAATWLPQDKWRKNPKDDNGKEMPLNHPEINWPIDWNKVQPYQANLRHILPNVDSFQYVQARSLTFADMPPLAQELCQKCQAKLEAYYQKHNIGYRQDDLERAALAAGVAAYGEKMTDLTMLNIKDGNIYVGHKTPQGVLNYASVNEQTAAATPEQDSIAQSKQAEIKLEEMERQREMEILAYQQSQSMGRSI